jgi:hypothetical protein
MKILNETITIYWWNFRKKTLDFKGSYKDFFKKKGFKLSQKTQDGIVFYTLRMPCGCSNITFKTVSTEQDFLDTAIKLFLTYLGDKAVFETKYRTYRINWN